MKLGQRAAYGIAVNVGKEMHAQTRPAFAVAQRIGDKPRAKIGTADADAHHVSRAGRDKFIDHRRHAHARGARLRRGFEYVSGHGKIAAQRGMQCGAAFGDVDDVSIEQPPERRCEIRRFGDGEQGFQRLTVVVLARETGIERTCANGECLRTSEVAGDQFGNRRMPQPFRVRLQRVESGSVVFGHDGLMGVTCAMPHLARSSARIFMQTKTASGPCDCVCWHDRSTPR